MGKDTYLVIGGSGFIGRHIVQMLLARGDSVSVLDIVQRYHDTPFYSADISNQAQVEEALIKSGASCIIHTASPPHGLDPAIYWKVNVEGTKAVIGAAIAQGVKKLVYTSSAGIVFNGQDLIDVDERLQPPEKAMDAYNESKAQGESLILAANGKGGLLTVAIRPAGVFGPGDKQMMAGLAEVHAKGQTHFQIGDNNNLFDFTYVENVALGHVLAADKLSESEKPINRSQVLEKALPSIDLSSGKRKIPTSAARPLGPIVDPLPNAAEIEKAFLKDSEPENRPVVRSRFDQFSENSLQNAEVDPLQVAGQAFFITNGEPVYFWDFSRAVWKELGAPDRSIIKFHKPIGLVLATLSEWWGWLVGKEPTFTRFRVTYACNTRWHNIEKARRVLGYEPKVGIAEGVKRTVEWYKAEHMNKSK